MSWVSVLKASFPYIRDIASVAIPAFTSRSDNNKSALAVPSEVDSVVQTQIKELQSAAVKNSESIKALAHNLEEMIRGLESSASQFKHRTEKLVALLYISTTIAVVALGCAIWAVVQ